MITLYGFRTIFSDGIGETKDLRAQCERCFSRPAWQRTLALYAERLGVRVDDIR